MLRFRDYDKHFTRGYNGSTVRIRLKDGFIYENILIGSFASRKKSSVSLKTSLVMAQQPAGVLEPGG